MKIWWYINRIRSMSIKEILFYRTYQFVNTKIIFRLRTLNYKTKKVELNPKFIGPKYSKEQIKNLFVNNQWNNTYSFFDTTVNLEDNLCWRKDYKSNTVSEICYAGNIDKQDFNKHGDVKYISELSRLHFLPFLAFKVVLEDNTNSNLINKIVKTWDEDNPFPFSINYTSGIEVAIRSISLIYTHHILNSFNELNTELDELIKGLIDKNVFYLKNHLSRYSSGNNHLVGELVGLVVISSYFEGHNISHKNKWRKEMLTKLLTKYNNDGMDDELSMRYHLAVTDHFLNGLQFIKNTGSIIENPVIEKLNKTLDFTDHINYFGRDSNFGDNDSSFLINPFFSKEFSYSTSITESLNMLLFNSRRETSVDFRNYLIFGERACRTTKVLSDRLQPKSTYFENSGYVFLYDHTHNIKITFDVGPVGDDRLMAHGHSDQLSFTVQKEDMEFIIDPGTYQYHKDKTIWRAYFRGIKSHNCVSINGKNHALSLNRMSWTKPSKVTIKEMNISEDLSVIRAQTNAFRSEGVHYSRELVLNTLERKLTVIDNLQNTTNKEQQSSFYLHFHPDLKIESDASIIDIKLPNGDKVKLENNVFKSSKMIYGRKEKPIGWYSETYDKKRESFSLISELILKKELNITTEIYY